MMSPEWHAKYYQKNKEKLNKKNKLWAKNNRKRSREIKRKYKQLHPEKDKNYYQKIKNNPEYKEQRRINHQNFLKNHPNYYKNWGKNNPEKKLSYDIKSLEKLLPYYKDLKDSWDMAYALSHWAETVKKRDNHICQNCGAKKKLHAHHIKPKFIYPKLALTVSNGVTFCSDCHEIYHLLNK